MRWLRHPFAADVLVADKLLALAFGAFGRGPMRGREQGLPQAPRRRIAAALHSHELLLRPFVQAAGERESQPGMVTSVKKTAQPKLAHVWSSAPACSLARLFACPGQTRTHASGIWPAQVFDLTLRVFEM